MQLSLEEKKYIYSHTGFKQEAENALSLVLVAGNWIGGVRVGEFLIP